MIRPAKPDEGVDETGRSEIEIFDVHLRIERRERGVCGIRGPTLPSIFALPPPGVFAVS